MMYQKATYQQLTTSLNREKTSAEKEKKSFAQFEAEEATRRTQYLNSREFQAVQLYLRIVAFATLGVQATLQQLKEGDHLPPDQPAPGIDLGKALDEAPDDILGAFD